MHINDGAWYTSVSESDYWHTGIGMHVCIIPHVQIGKCFVAVCMYNIVMYYTSVRTMLDSTTSINMNTISYRCRFPEANQTHLMIDVYTRLPTQNDYIITRCTLTE